MKPLDVSKNPEPEYLDAEFATQAQIDKRYPPVPPERVAELAEKYPDDISKIFSPRAKAKARLTRKLKAKRNYAKPVRGGTGKQYRTRRNRFSKSDE